MTIPSISDSAATDQDADPYSSPAALAAFMHAPAGVQLDPVTRQYLVFAFASEMAARTGAIDFDELHALCDFSRTICKPELMTALPATRESVGQVCNLLAQACAELAPSQDFEISGRLISLEGGDGVGKTTQTQLLAEHLSKQGIKTVATRAIGGAGGAASELRDFILDPRYQWSPLAEALLTASVYRETFVKVIFPALTAGHTVICDRLLDTLLVYLQNEEAGLGDSALRQIFDILVSDMAPGLEPDVTFILDLPFEVALSRRNARRADRNEAKGEAFHRQVVEKYRQLAASSPRFVLVDALQLPATLTYHLAQELDKKIISSEV